MYMHLLHYVSARCVHFIKTAATDADATILVMGRWPAPKKPPEAEFVNVKGV